MLRAKRTLHGFGGCLGSDGWAGYNRLVAPEHVGPDTQISRPLGPSEGEGTLASFLARKCPHGEP